MTTDNGAESFAIHVDNSSLEREAAQAASTIEGIGEKAVEQGYRIDSAFDKIGRNIRNTLLGISFAEFERQIINTRKEMEALQISFQTLAGTQVGKQLYEDIKQFAATTPMMMGDLAKGAQTLLGFNIEAEKVMPILRQIGDISMGDAQKFGSLTLAFAQMSSTGKLMGQDLLQMINAGFNPLVIIAEKTGKTIGELKEEMAQGKISVEMVEDAFKSAASEGGKFNGMLQQQAKGMKGAIAQMEGAIQNTLNDFGEAQEGILVDGIHLITKAIENYETIGKVILTVAAAYGSWKATQMAVVAYQNVIAKNQAAIEAQRIASLQTIAATYEAEQAAEASDTAATNANTAAKEANKTATDLLIAEIGKEMAAKLAAAEADLVAANQASLIAANRLREAQASTRYYERQYQAALLLGDGEKIEAAENALNTAASNENAAAKAAQAAQENAATAARAKEAAATRLSTFQTQVDTTNKQANTAATGLWAAVTRSATAAMQGLKAAMASNPFGLVLVAITTIISALTLFTSETEKSTEALDKLRDAALEDTQKLATYRAVLENVDKSSTQYKNTMRDLNAMAGDYHTTIFEENDTVEELTEKYNELTEAIRANAAQRILSESASKATKDAMEAEKNAMTELMEEAEDASYYTLEQVQKNIDGVWVLTYDSVENNSNNIRNITAATWNSISTLVMENARKMADAFEESPEKGEEAVKAMVKQIEGILRSLGVTDKEIEGFHDALYEYVENSAKGFQTAYNELGRTEAQLKGIAAAATDTKDVMNDAIDKMNYEQLQDELVKVQKEIDKVNDKTINPSVDTTRLQQLEAMLQRIKDLMPGQLTVGSDADLEKRLKKAKEERDKNVYGSEEWNKQNDLVRQLNTTLATHKKGYAENAEKTTRSGETAAQRRAKQQKQQQEYLAEQSDMARERIRAAYDLWEATEQAEINAMQNGTARSLRQIELDYKKRQEELRRQYEDLRHQKWEEDKRLWEANPANKDKAFTGNEDDSKYDFTADERKMLERQAQAALQEYQMEQDQLMAESRQFMLEYLKEYGSLQEQKAAIMAEYQRKISLEQDEWERRRLTAERDRLLGEADFKALQKSINWDDVFNDIDRHSTTYLQALKKKLQKAIDARDITAENAKVLAEKIREIEESIGTRTNIWQTLLPGLRERKRLTEATAQAEQLWVKALNEEATAINSVLSDKRQIQDKLNTVGIQVELEAISEENKDKLLSSIEQGTPLYNSLLQLFKNLAASTNTAQQKHEQTQHKKNALDMQWDKLKSMKSIGDVVSWANGNPLEIIEGVASNAQSMSDLIDKIGLENTDFGQAVHGFSEGVNGFNSAVQSLAKGDIFGAVNGVLDGIAGFGKMGINALIGGGNESEKESEIAELTKSQERLADAIDSLADKIMKSDATNAQSIEYYRTALQAEKEWEDKQRKKIDDRASEYANTGYGFLGLSGKGSFNAHMAGNGWAGWQTFSDILKKHQGENGVTHDSVSRGSIWNLTPEEMRLLKEFAPKEWEALFNGDGHRNPEELVNEYIERAGKQDELTSALNQKLTGYDWEGFIDSYKSLLKDLDSTTEDFADHINEMITNALIESFVNETLKEDIDELYQYIAQAAMDGIDAQEQAEIDRRNKAISDKSLAWRQNMIAAGRINPDSDSSYSQNASRNSLSGMTQEQGAEMNGRLTAVQIATYNIAEAVEAQSGDVATIKAQAMAIRNSMDDLIDNQTTAIGHLEKIEKYTSELPAMKQQLMQIRQNTAGLTTKK